MNLEQLKAIDRASWKRLKIFWTIFLEKIRNFEDSDKKLPIFQKTLFEKS